MFTMSRTGIQTLLSYHTKSKSLHRLKYDSLIIVNSKFVPQPAYWQYDHFRIKLDNIAILLAPAFIRYAGNGWTFYYDKLGTISYEVSNRFFNIHRYETRFTCFNIPNHNITETQKQYQEIIKLPMYVAVPLAYNLICRLVI